jgi:hypothetical protein
MVDSELMYQTTTLDPHLGYRVLPKVFKDGWTSVDDDLSYFVLVAVLTCKVYVCSLAWPEKIHLPKTRSTNYLWRGT